MKDEIREQIIALLKLQTIDSFLKNLYDKKKTLPEEIDKLEGEKQELISKLEKDRDLYEKAKVQHEEIERKIAELMEALKEAEDRLMKVRNQEEYEKAQKEVSLIKNEIANQEGTRPQVENELEVYGERVEAREKELEEKLPGIESEIAYRKRELERIDRIIREFEKWREEFFQRVDVKYRGKYSALIRRGIYDAIVPVDGNSCTGCSITLPPQLVSNVQRGNDIYRCINCVRFLYIPFPEAEEAVKEIQEEIEKKFAALMEGDTESDNSLAEEKA